MKRETWNKALGDTMTPTKLADRLDALSGAVHGTVYKDIMREAAIALRVLAPQAMTMAEARALLQGPARCERDVPWQFAVGDYCVRTDERGEWGIYLRAYNYRVARFNANSAAIRDALTRMFNAAHALVESCKLRK
jgi:hypothetical protein